MVSSFHKAEADYRRKVLLFIGDLHLGWEGMLHDSRVLFKRPWDSNIQTTLQLGSQTGL